MKKSIKCLLIGAFILSIFVMPTFAQHDQHNTENTDFKATHGMLIFGQDVFYAAHLGMFAAPHDYQGLFRLKLDDKSAQLFKKDQLAHPEYTTYTIQPEPFILPDMVKTPRHFKAKLFRGHFERGGELIAESIDIVFEKIVIFKKFDLKAPREKALKCLIVGSGKERFAVHLISAKPDFDQIIQVKTNLLEGTEYTFPDTTNKVLGVNGNMIEEVDAANKRKLIMILLKQIYLEFGDFGS